MIKTIFTILLIVCCAINSLAQTQISTNSQIGFSDEEYKFWAENWCSTDAYLDDVNLKVIQIETLPMTVSLEKERNFIPKIRDYYAKAKFTDTTTDLIQDFNAKNDKSYLLERKFAGCKNYVLVTKTDVSDIFKNSKDGWKDFNVKYPKSGGFERFSRIGFSPDKKQAVIFLSYSCGWLCASGDFYFFVKEEGEWIEKVKQNVWVS
ncbi:MAG: hypothetical protein ACR2F2_01885 [Pyrinomonadaceae bacterium]